MNSSAVTAPTAEHAANRSGNQLHIAVDGKLQVRMAESASVAQGNGGDSRGVMITDSLYTTMSATE